jgi:hypothetical protein
MKIFSFSCALGVAVTAWGMVAFGPESGFAAGKLHLPGSADLVRKSAEPFGIFAFRPSGGELREKWLAVQHKFKTSGCNWRFATGSGNAAYPRRRFDSR